MKYALALCILLAISCKSQDQNSVSTNQLKVLVRDSYFPVEEPSTQIIEDEKTLRKLYSAINKTRKPGIPVPVIDFTYQSVLVACLGPTNTEDLPEMIIKDENTDELFISVKKNQKQTKSEATFYPFCIYLIDRGNKKLALEIN